ncbi:MAG: orotate phosphoribosyltransferase [Marinilabiliaceae bacterium]
MKKLEDIIATQLLQIKAIKLQPANPFTWASGWLSPIYCDNRKTLSWPDVRTFIKIQFARRVMERWPQTDVIAGVATGAIAQGAMVADELGKPFVYVRSSPKSHGLENLVEGELVPGSKVVVIEDLISTGGSSLKALEALRKQGAEVLGMLAIFSYGFQVAEDNFASVGVEYETLSNYQALLKVANEGGYVSSDEMDTLARWREDPSNWPRG